jgi:hypothetical protein
LAAGTSRRARIHYIVDTSSLLQALNFLRQQGSKYVKSVKGGITAWSDQIDAKVPRY